MKSDAKPARYIVAGKESPMEKTIRYNVLSQVVGAEAGFALSCKQAALLVAGVLFLALAAKIKVPMWPVPITMGTFAVLTIGAAYGPRLGLVTMMVYMLVGALGFDVFAGSSAEVSGLSYMLGGTGGYLVGYVMATLALGVLAQRGWDRSVSWMALAMLIGNSLIYIPGVLWLGQLYGWDKPILAWGLTPFLVGDALKLALAAVLLPVAWKLVSRARD
jgi:biotin transport system substrate-specific component